MSTSPSAAFQRQPTTCKWIQIQKWLFIFSPTNLHKSLLFSITTKHCVHFMMSKCVHLCAALHKNHFIMFCIESIESHDFVSCTYLSNWNIIGICCYFFICMNFNKLDWYPSGLIKKNYLKITLETLNYRNIQSLLFVKVCMVFFWFVPIQVPLITETGWGSEWDLSNIIA